MGALEGKVAVVTGGASGIGLATAQRFAAEGASVVVVDRNADDGERVAKELDGRFVAADVGSPADWKAIVAETESAFGGIDVAYLNAGVTTGESNIDALTDEQYRRIMGANVDGVVFGAASCRARDRGRVAGVPSWRPRRSLASSLSRPIRSTRSPSTRWSVWCAVWRAAPGEEHHRQRDLSGRGRHAPSRRGPRDVAAGRLSR